jgi:hypothetical protein
MIVVSNASPLLALAQADSFHLLKALFARILIPDAVYRETVDQCPVPIQKQRIKSALDDFIVVTAPKSTYRFSRSLGDGEKGVLQVALEQNADLLELARYIVLNPVRAGMVHQPGAWSWSSYRATAGEEETPPFLTTHWLLRAFAEHENRW